MTIAFSAIPVTIRVMPIRYRHTNIVARDWRKLAEFYSEVFACRPIPPTRDQSDEKLGRGIGVAGAKLTGTHLLLPGFPEGGPTLEIYQYEQMQDAPSPVANRPGFTHIAFEVDDVGATLAKLIKYGGSAVGETVTLPVEGAGKVTFVYAADPEGNIVEIQRWD